MLASLCAGFLHKDRVQVVWRRADKAVSSEQRAHLDALDRQVEEAARLVIVLGVVLLLLGFHLAKFF
jgi:hypothetical protein